MAKKTSARSGKSGKRKNSTGRATGPQRRGSAARTGAGTGVTLDLKPAIHAVDTLVALVKANRGTAKDRGFLDEFLDAAAKFRELCACETKTMTRTF